DLGLAANVTAGLLVGLLVSLALIVLRPRGAEGGCGAVCAPARKGDTRLPNRADTTGPAASGNDQPNGVVISVHDIVDEMVETDGECSAFLNRITGELVTLTEDVRDALENGEPSEDLPAAEQERLTAFRCLLQSGELLELPSSFETQEYSIRQRFCQSLPENEQRQRLLSALDGPTAFRSFDKLVRKLGLRDAWSGYRDRAFEEIAVAWLESNQIAYDRSNASA
ncbi:MAG: hypothetical protein ACYSTY_06745, partial [Planctomycetota bacterium]